MNKPYHFYSGSSPLLVSMPHSGTVIPQSIADEMTPAALRLADVDWHLPQLYTMAENLGASILSAEYMRYVIDLNRSPEDDNLYPGQDTTSLCPIDTFAKEPIYRTENSLSKAPDQAIIQRRIAQYWQPYHEKLQTELSRIRAIHGVVVLWEAHSIASKVPRFFDGRLPDLNFGTSDGQSCDISLQQRLMGTLQSSSQATPYSHVFNGRFKGGYITRQYGVPTDNIHAVQLEISQRTYMDEHPPYGYQPKLASQLQPLLRDLLVSCQSWADAHRA